MTNLNDYIEKVKKWSENVLNWRSDDFGHDTQALLLAESKALQDMGDHVEKLIRIVEVQAEALKFYADESRYNDITVEVRAPASTWSYKSTEVQEDGGDKAKQTFQLVDKIVQSNK